MTKQEAAVIETYTGIVMLTGDDRIIVNKYMSNIMGRPIFSHELASLTIQRELKAKAKADFIRICENLTNAEDVEDAGTLARLPCKVGDTVYRVCKRVDSRKNGHVRKVEVTPRNISFVEYCLQKGEYFLDREEAEEALKETE